MPVLYWAGIPGNAGDFPAEESFYTFLNRRYASFPERPITETHPVLSVSVWRTVRTGFRYMWTFPTFP
ncbi:hypothetical protein [Parabacteroides distasonis]|uniref:hypothetical protein n=1 Tax=Parabacteroides distasonis TaxID=823 RepID=UPI001D102FEC